jgi:hypothetical protein
MPKAPRPKLQRDSLGRYVSAMLGIAMKSESLSTEPAAALGAVTDERSVISGRNISMPNCTWQQPRRDSAPGFQLSVPEASIGAATAAPAMDWLTAPTPLRTSPACACARAASEEEGEAREPQGHVAASRGVHLVLTLVRVFISLGKAAPLSWLRAGLGVVSAQEASPVAPAAGDVVEHRSISSRLLSSSSWSG